MHATVHIFSNLEYSFLVRELSRSLIGKHFARIKKLGQSTYRIKIGSNEILCELGVRIHITRYLEQSGDADGRVGGKPDKFAEKVNKELDNARLVGVEQINNDRIVSFNFDCGCLIFEMFGEGNAILVRDGKTVTAHKFESWSGREIKAGCEYSPPKASSSVSPQGTRILPFENVEVSDRYIVVSLMKLPLGKDYVLEALTRAGINEKTPGNELTKNQVDTLQHALYEIRSGVRPHAFYESGSGKMVDFALVTLSKYKSLERTDFPTISEVADEYYQHVELPNPALEKLLDRLEKQKERMTALLEEEKSDRLKGDHIYAHYAEVESLISLAKAGKFEEIEKNHRGKIDRKEKTIEVEL